MARIFITGSSDGLGLAAARTLTEQGHEVILHARSAERAKALLETQTAGVAGVAIGDLSRAGETRDVAAQVNAIGGVHAVIHNAGIYASPDRADTPEGRPGILAVNTLAPYALTALIERPKRLVYLSSGLHRDGEGSLDDIDWTKRRWDAAHAYAESKVHVVALAFFVARLWPEVFANAVDPGWARTRMGGSSAPVDIATGQRTQSWLAASDDPAARVSGRYWHDMRREQPIAEASNEAFQEALVARLESLTGVSLQ